MNLILILLIATHNQAT